MNTSLLLLLLLSCSIEICLLRMDTGEEGGVGSVPFSSVDVVDEVDLSLQCYNKTIRTIEAQVADGSW